MEGCSLLACFLLACSACSLIEPRLPAQRWYHLQGDFPPWSLIEKMLCSWVSWKHFPNWSSFLCDSSSLCQVDTKPASKQVWILVSGELSFHVSSNTSPVTGWWETDEWLNGCGVSDTSPLSKPRLSEREGRNHVERGAPMDRISGLYTVKMALFVWYEQSTLFPNQISVWGSCCAWELASMPCDSNLSLFCLEDGMLRTKQKMRGV